MPMGGGKDPGADCAVSRPDTAIGIDANTGLDLQKRCEFPSHGVRRDGEQQCGRISGSSIDGARRQAMCGPA